MWLGSITSFLYTGLEVERYTGVVGILVGVDPIYRYKIEGNHGNQGYYRPIT